MEHLKKREVNEKIIYSDEEVELKFITEKLIKSVPLVELLMEEDLPCNIGAIGWQRHLDKIEYKQSLYMNDFLIWTLTSNKPKTCELIDENLTILEFSKPISELKELMQNINKVNSESDLSNNEELQKASKQYIEFVLRCFFGEKYKDIINNNPETKCIIQNYLQTFLDNYYSEKTNGSVAYTKKRVY